MTVFADTSAVYAILDEDDASHERAAKQFIDLSNARETLVTSNYVLLETLTLTSRRLGLAAARDFQLRMAPLFHVHWVDEDLHARSVATLFTAGRRRLSLVDCVSFELMRRLGLDTAFAFDEHFEQQGFRTL
jgi:uncharacterized protein